ncbi:MAG: AI-2E family transporter [Victivallales bacterium]|nr:AI-2E family transporter [Victivallales bacterium]
MDEPQQIKAKNIAPYAFAALTLLLLFGVLFLVKGFLHALILGIIGATMLMPVHRRILKGISHLNKRLPKFSLKKSDKKETPAEQEGEYTSGEKRAAALCSVTLVFFCVLIPLTFFLFTLVNQGEKVLADAKTWLAKGPDGRSTLTKHLEELDSKYQISRRWGQLNALNNALDFGVPEIKQEEKNHEEAEKPSQEGVDDASAEQKPQTKNVTVVQESPEKMERVQETELQELAGKVATILQNCLSSIIRTLMGVAKQIWMMVVNFFIMLLVMFFGFRDGESFVKYVRDISPFSDKVQEQILDRISEVSRAVLFGILGTALVQSLVAMVIFRIVGIPALLWGSLLGMCSLIPFIGTSLVWIPITIYFLLIGQPWQALFVVFGCGGIVANVDNFMRPAFICGGRTGMSYIVLFCSLLGGLQTFGLAGVVYGPLISGLCALCLYIFGTQYKNRTM